MWWPGTESVPLPSLIARKLLFLRRARSARTSRSAIQKQRVNGSVDLFVLFSERVSDYHRSSGRERSGQRRELKPIFGSLSSVLPSIVKEHPHKSPHTPATSGAFRGICSSQVFEKFGSPPWTRFELFLRIQPQIAFSH